VFTYPAAPDESQSVPGAATADYNTAGLTRPVNPGWNVVINRKNNNDTSSTHYYNIKYYNYAWGPLGPNDFLSWVGMDCCDALGLLKSGGDLDQALNEMGATWPGTFSSLWSGQPVVWSLAPTAGENHRAAEDHLTFSK
jgi:hypothetical protein